MSSVFFAAAATAAAGAMSGDRSAATFEQPTAPPARSRAASPAPVAPRRVERRTEDCMCFPQGTERDGREGPLGHRERMADAQREP